MNLIDGENGRKMVNTRVDTDLVEHGDARLFSRSIKLHHGGRDVRGCDNVLLLADGGLDHSSVISVRNQADNNIDLSNLSIEGFSVVDIELPSSACQGIIKTENHTLIGWVFGMPLTNACAFSRVLQATVTLTPDFASTSTVGRVLRVLVQNTKLGVLIMAYTKPAPSRSADLANC